MGFIFKLTVTFFSSPSVNFGPFSGVVVQFNRRGVMLSIGVR